MSTQFANPVSPGDLGPRTRIPGQSMTAHGVALAPLGDDFAGARGALEDAKCARIVRVDMNRLVVIVTRDDERHWLDRDELEGQKGI
ncbi:hypothetical protein COCOBI_07-0380 [Coccomyxa sp. Obi]|nr:hypothetical protein COCOBI_07-0380 [Coccomyxa sp. Obi]